MKSQPLCRQGDKECDELLSLAQDDEERVAIDTRVRKRADAATSVFIRSQQAPPAGPFKRLSIVPRVHGLEDLRSLQPSFSSTVRQFNEQ